MAATAPKVESNAVPEKLLVEARRLKLEIADRSEEQLRQAVREAWIKENRDAMEAWNVWVRKNGLPLDHYRMF